MPLRYFGLRVTDLDRSARFYTELLGLKELFRGRMDHGGVFVQLEDPETRQRLELNWYPPGSAHDAPFVAGEGLDHLGFKVDDARAWHERALAFGAESALPPHEQRHETYDETLAYVKDPDGNWVEFYDVREKEGA